MLPNQAILVINGEIDTSFLKNYIKLYLQSLPIYCVDGAFKHICSETSLASRVRMIIGDGDSVDPSAYSSNIHYYKDSGQNSTDLDKALRFLKATGYRNLFLFGLGGKEMDHYLGNISTLIEYKDVLSFKIIDYYSISYMMTKEMKLTGIKGKMISIIPLFELRDISLRGFAFNLRKDILKFGKSLSVRNHAVRNDIFVNYLSGNGIIFISHRLYHRFPVSI